MLTARHQHGRVQATLAHAMAGGTVLALVVGGWALSATRAPHSVAVAKPARLAAVHSPLVAGASAAHGLALSRGDRWLSHPGTLANTHVTGSVYISGSHVSLTNVLVDGTVFVNRTPAGRLANPPVSDIVVSSTTAAGIYSYGYDGLTLDSVLIAKPGAPAVARLGSYRSGAVTYPASRLTVQDCWFRSVVAAGANSASTNLDLAGVQGAIVRDNRFDLLGAANTRSGGGSNVVLAASPGARRTSRVVIDGNEFQGGSAGQLPSLAKAADQISNNQFFTASAVAAGSRTALDIKRSEAFPGGPLRFWGNRVNGWAVTLPGFGGTARRPGNPRTAGPSAPAPSPSSSAPASSDAPSAAPSSTAPSSSVPSSSAVSSIVPTAAPDSSPSSTPTPTPTSSSPAPPIVSPLSAGPDPSVPLTTNNGDLWLSASASAANLHVTGSLYISGSNVTVSNVKVDGTIYINFTPSGMYFAPVPANILLTHVSGTNMFSNGFNSLTLDSVELVNTQDAPHAQLFNYSDRGTSYPASNLVIQNSWFHGLRTATTAAHVENLHLGGVQGAIIRNNEFDMSAPDANTLQYITANIDLETQMYGVFNTNIVFDHNVITGGGYYQLYFCAAGGSAVTNNQFLTGTNPRLAGVQYPPSAYGSTSLPNGHYVAPTQGGNTLDGRPITLPTS